MLPALGAVLGLPHPVAGVVIRRGLKFQTCTNTLNKFFITIPGIFGYPHVHVKEMEMQLQSDHNLKSLSSPAFYVTCPTASRTPSGMALVNET
jgi:hypothetical protein